MKDLPDSLAPNSLELMPLPDEVRLGEAKRFFENGSIMKGVREALQRDDPTGKIKIRFIITSTTGEEEAPDSMPIGAFRILVKAKKGHMDISFGEGGIPVELREPV